MEPVKLSDLLLAIEAPSEDCCSKVDRLKGRVVTLERHVLEAVEEEDDEALACLPDWEKEDVEIARAILEDTTNRFIEAPDKFEFHEYRHMERFIGTVDDPDAVGQLWSAIKGKGAFRYFKDTAIRLGLIDRWYRYRDDAMRNFVIEWAEFNEVSYIDDEKTNPAP